MVLTVWNLRERSRRFVDLQAAYEGVDNYFTLKIYYSGVFTKPPRRKYVDGTITYVDFVDTDLFSVHELDDMVREIGYQKEQTLYYHYCIPDFPLDFGLMPLGNDEDVIKLVTYVPKHRQISVYIESGETRVSNYFKSPSKVVIEELEPKDVSPELNRRRGFRKETGSCSRKLDMNETMVDRSIVPYRSTYASQQSQVINEESDANARGVENITDNEEHVQDVQEAMHHVDCNIQNVEDLTVEDDGDGVQDREVDEYESFLQDYTLLG